MTSGTRAWRAVALCVAATVVACQNLAPKQAGASLVYVSGFIKTLKGNQPMELRLDRQACLTASRVSFRDASGLGVLVITTPPAGWIMRQYSYPQSLGSARGYLNVAGISASYPLARGKTVITHTDESVLEGEIDWTLGQPLEDGGVDTTIARLRAVGSFHAVADCGN